MIVPAIGGIVPKPIVIVNRNTAIIVVMMVSIDADLCRAMRRIVCRPCRNRHAHAECQPYEGKQAQQRTNSVMHEWVDSAEAHSVQLNTWRQQARRGC